MIVKLILGTKGDPGPKVGVESNIRFVDVESFDNWLKAQKVAREWLRKELGR